MTNQVAGAHPGACPVARIAAGHAVVVPAAVTSARGRPDSLPRSRVRTLQLALSCLWLLDAVLQFQAFMFGHGFAGMLGQSAQGNPAVIAGPITWSASFVAQHHVAVNSAFAAVQLAIGLDYAFARPGLVARKRRKLELTAGAPPRRGTRSMPAAAYSSKQVRDQEWQAAQPTDRSPTWPQRVTRGRVCRHCRQLPAVN